jgi:glutathione peroxidase
VPNIRLATFAGAVALLALLAVPALSEPRAPAPKEMSAMPATQFTAIDGKPLDLTHLGAKAILVVNTASKCGFTPQYKGLEELYQAKKDEGLVIVGVPSNDFGAQEPGTEAEVKTFCEINYGVTFPLTRKYAVTGADKHPFFAAAVAALGDDAQPKWNFHKVLIKGDGTPLKAYPSKVKPDDAGLAADIEAALKG